MEQPQNDRPDFSGPRRVVTPKSTRRPWPGSHQSVAGHKLQPVDQVIASMPTLLFGRRDR